MSDVQKFPKIVYASVYYPQSSDKKDKGMADIISESKLEAFGFREWDDQYIGVYELKQVIHLDHDSKSILDIHDQHVEVEENVK